MLCVEHKKKSNVAVRSNDIIEARFSLTPRQNNILDMVFCEIEDDKNYSYEISVEKYKSLYETDTSNIYRDLKKATKKLEGKGFRIIDKDTKEEIFYPWFSKIHYIPREGKINVNIDMDFKKILYEVRKKIYYDIKYTLNFNSSYSQKIYYYLKSFEDTGWRIDVLEDLQYKLECPKTYYNFSNFKKFVLDVAQKEINEKSDIFFNYDLKKKGKKVTHIKFNIYNKKKMKEEVAVDSDLNNSNNNDGNNSRDCYDNDFFLEVKNIFQEYFTDLEISTLLSVCDKSMKKLKIKQNKLDYIKEKKEVVDKYCKNNSDKDINYIGVLIKAIKENWNRKNKTNDKESDRFNDFPQRKYDYDKLEKQLLGWDKEDEN
nr:replication initiation protein [Clostridium botulinum]